MSRATPVTLALGRLMRMAQRPYQEGDIEDYERCRVIIMADADAPPDWTPNYARDRNKGAPGD